MKKTLGAAGLALSLLVAQPGISRAEWNSPQCSYGYGWLQSRALLSAPWLHFHGPLYNYGPYNTEGHVQMFVPNPTFGAYIPAYPASYYGGYAYQYPNGWNTLTNTYGQAPQAPSMFPPTISNEPPLGTSESTVPNSTSLKPATPEPTAQPAALGTKSPAYGPIRSFFRR